MKTFFKIVLGLMALILLGAVVLYFLFPQPKVTPGQEVNGEGSGSEQPFGGGSEIVGGATSTATSTGTTIPAGKMIITGENGKSIMINDVRIGITPKRGTASLYYELTGEYVATSTRYSIIYTDNDEGFTIALFQEPLGVVRKEAEVKLLGLLGITENDACNLKYDLGVPYSVSEQYSGKNLGFSFCPNAVLLPEI
jgi:hypothetical protein